MDLPNSLRPDQAAQGPDLVGQARLTAYVVPTRAKPVDLVSRWSQIYDETYRTAARAADPRFDVVGWNSSTTSDFGSAAIAPGPGRSAAYPCRSVPIR